MKQFIGTKIVKAKVMNRLDYNLFRGWKLPDDENGSDDGYLVEYLDGGEPNTKEYNGYVSWSPKEQFENAYKESGNLSFGDAITYLKQGKKVARKIWNGKKMFLFYVPSSSYIAMKTTQDNVVPWLASQIDMLSDDWEVL